MTLNVNLLLCRQFYATKWLKLESRGFHYKVALYYSYLPIKFDDDTEGGPLIWGLKIRWGGFQLRRTIS